MSMNQRTYALIGAALALTAYVLAGTVLAGTDAEGPVMLIGGIVAGWLGLPQPRSK